MFIALLGVVGAACSQPDTDRIVLGNERLSVALSQAQKGTIVSVWDRHAGRELVPEAGSGRLFTLVLSEAADAKPVYVSNTDAVVFGAAVEEGAAGRRAQLTFTNCAGRGIGVRIAVSAPPGDAYVRFRLEEVSLPEGLTLEQVQFPIVVLRAPLGESEDRAVMGNTKGGVHHRPSAWKTGDMISAGQPGSLAAQFTTYFDAQGGVTIAAQDALGVPKGTWFRRTDSGLEAVWTAPCFAAGRFALDHDYVMTTFGGSEGAEADWRDAADLYKIWAERQPWCAKRYAERRDVPDWMHSGPAMVRFGRDWLAEPDEVERWLTEYWRNTVSRRAPLIVACWGWEKVDYWITPDYFPLYPSDEGFGRFVEAARRAGGHVFPWPSGYHYTLTYDAQEDGTFAWDDRERFRREAEAHAVVGRNGSVWTMKPSWLRGGETACLCPGDPWTRDWWNGTCEELLRRGADMVQVDQVVGGRFPDCYSAQHGHPPGPGLWVTEVFHEQLRTMLQRCRALDPGAVIGIEEPNEHFIQEVAVQDYRDLEAYGIGKTPEPASVFNYLYHEYLPTFQSNPRRLDRRTAAYCLVNGQIPHLVPSRDIGPGPLLGNGGFEEWGRDVPLGWDRVSGWQGEVWKGRCFRDDQERHGGECSLRLECTEGETVQVSRNLAPSGAFRVGGTYRLSAWMKSGDLAQRNVIMVGALTHDLQSKGGCQLPMPAVGAGWTQAEATVEVPEGTDFVRIMIHLSGRGAVWVDDMRLEEVRDDGTVAEVAREEVPPDHELMRQWITLFAGEGRPYLLLGRTLHPPALQVHGAPAEPPILHNAYRAPNGSEAVVLVNASNTPQQAELTWHGERRELGFRPWEVRLVR